MKVKFLQEGGQVSSAPEGAPAQAGPEEQIMQLAQQLIQQLGPEGVTMLVQVLAEMLQGASQQAPQQGQPTYAKKGGKIVFNGYKK